MSDSKKKFDNFFTLFNQPLGFDVDQDKLDEQLQTLQQQYHPDKLATNNDDNADKQAQKNSAIINHAYNTLRHPDSRADYLLQLANQEMNNNDTIADLDFLEDAMALRMDLDDALMASDINTLNSISKAVDDKLAQQSQRFKTAYSEKNWSDAKDATQKLRFLTKLNKDVATAVDNSHQTGDDEDLYL